MSKPKNKTVRVTDRAGRRGFMRRGAAFIAVGGAIAVHKPTYADDCDRNEGEPKNASAAGSDSDAGEGSDPTGCGKRPTPKISMQDRQIETKKAGAVKKIKA